MKSILAMRKEIESCTKCDLCEGRTNPVPGSGSADADIMLVGEAPGRSEDLRGVPFVGAAGKKLDEALEHAGLNRDSVYITNVVKCRPPDNRVPTDSERAECRAYLELEIKAIKPKIICIMGNTAYGSLLGGRNIMKERGKTIKQDGRDYFLTIHPAAAIYNQKLVKTLKSDLALLARIARP